MNSTTGCAGSGNSGAVKGARSMNAGNSASGSRPAARANRRCRARLRAPWPPCGPPDRRSHLRGERAGDATAIRTAARTSASRRGARRSPARRCGPQARRRPRTGSGRRSHPAGTVAPRDGDATAARARIAVRRAACDVAVETSRRRSIDRATKRRRGSRPLVRLPTIFARARTAAAACSEPGRRRARAVSSRRPRENRLEPSVDLVGRVARDRRRGPIRKPPAELLVVEQSPQRGAEGRRRRRARPATRSRRRRRPRALRRRASRRPAYRPPAPRRRRAESSPRPTRG